MQCTTLYPCPPEQIGLGTLSTFRQRYGCPVGLSDHSGKVYAGLAAAALGADLLEVHVTLSRSMPGPDVRASLTPDELSFFVQGVREVERMLAPAYEKDALARELRPLRELFSHSVVALREIPPGTVLQRKDLGSKKPGTGIPASRIADVVGRRTRKALRPDQLIAEEDLD
jgi:N-acetylneuraminate synthase